MYDLSGTEVKQRIDRKYSLGNIWLWGRPSLEPNDVSIVVHGGPTGYACYNRGNEVAGLPANVVWGYTDGSMY